MKWRSTTNDDFNEDWMFSHYRYKSDHLKLDTDLFEIRDGALIKIGGTGRLPFYEVEILDESTPPVSAMEKALRQIEQMSDPGSYELAIVRMKAIATKALTTPTKLVTVKKKDMKKYMIKTETGWVEVPPHEYYQWEGMKCIRS